MAVPYMDPSIFEKMELREGDVFISTGAKQGTTWNCYIVQQLLSNCNNNFQYLLEATPWAEYVQYPGQSIEERLKKLNDMPKDQRRAFKTHMCPPILPLNPRVKYVICIRNPIDSAISVFHFLNNHTEEFRALWNCPPKFENMEIFTEFVKQVDTYWDFVNAWWSHRFDQNVFMVHYSELKNRPTDTIRRMAEFLEVPVLDMLIQQVVTNTSFENMKVEEEKFEGVFAGKNAEIPGLRHGAMLRKGAVGNGNEAPAHFKEVYQKLCKLRCLDDEQLEWCTNGGKITCTFPGM